jgi:hypothetical protein
MEKSLLPTVFAAALTVCALGAKAFKKLVLLIHSDSHVL